MKTRKLIIVAVILLVGFLTTEASDSSKRKTYKKEYNKEFVWKQFVNASNGLELSTTNFPSMSLKLEIEFNEYTPNICITISNNEELKSINEDEFFFDESILYDEVLEEDEIPEEIILNEPDFEFQQKTICKNLELNEDFLDEELPNEIIENEPDFIIIPTCHPLLSEMEIDEIPEEVILDEPDFNTNF